MKKYQEKEIKGLNRAQLIEKLEENKVEFDLSSKNDVLRNLLLSIEVIDPEDSNESKDVDVEVIDPEDALLQPKKSRIQQIIEERQLRANTGIVQLSSVEAEIRKRQAKVGGNVKSMTVEEIIKERQNKL